MKKIKIAVVVMLSAMSTVLMAQAMKTWEWKSHNVKFQVPANFKVTQNTANIFSANDGKDFTVSIAPWNDGKLDAKGVAKAVFNRYGASNKQVHHEEAVNLQDHDAYIMIGEGIQSGKTVNIIIVGFIDKNSDFNLAAQFFWWDNPDKNDDFVELAKRIVESIDNIQ